MNSAARPRIGGKWWVESVTVWGALMTALATVLPALGAVFGFDITGDLVRHAGDRIVEVAQGLAGLVGILMTVYGRARADRPLERRTVSIRF